MKKNRMMRLASILLVCVLLTTSVISGTFAKYTSEGSVTDTARVAKWDIKLEGETITKNVDIDLFATSYKNPADNDVTVHSDTDNVIAPGTKGSFEIDLKNESEVDAEYAISYEISNAAGVPLEFSLTGNDDDWKSTIADLNCEKQALPMDATDASTVTVYWRWTFNPATGRTDADDTYLGTLGTLPTVTVTATITVDQVD